MLIKLGNSSVINMRAISSVHVTAEDKRTEIASNFWEPKKYTTEKRFTVIVYYTDKNDKDTNFSLTDFHTLEGALRVKDEVLSQVKELEMDTMSQVLDSAIRGGGSG